MSHDQNPYAPPTDSGDRPSKALPLLRLMLLTLVEVIAITLLVIGRFVLVGVVLLGFSAYIGMTKEELQGQKSQFTTPLSKGQAVRYLLLGVVGIGFFPVLAKIETSAQWSRGFDLFIDLLLVSMGLWMVCSQWHRFLSGKRVSATIDES